MEYNNNNSIDDIKDVKDTNMKDVKDNSIDDMKDTNTNIKDVKDNSIDDMKDVKNIKDMKDTNAKDNTLNKNDLEILNKIFHEHTECNFVKDHVDICSPDKIVDKMKEFTEEKGVKTDKKKVVTDIKKLLDCESESCVIKNKEFLKFAKIEDPKKILNTHFKPEGPALNFDLLSNFNIDDVLDQFEKKFSERKFLHIPFQMRDFEAVGSDLAWIDLADKFNSGYKTFGVVINTDYSRGGGIHWFSLFGEKTDKKIVLEYFNSSGLPPLEEVQIWLNKTKHHLHKTLKIPTEIYYNTGIEFQTDMHSCGVYSLAYIWLRLEGISPRWFKPDNFNDELMHKLRKNLFRWEN